MRSRDLAVAAVLLVAATLSACGSSRPQILNTEGVERAIERSILQERKLQSTVSCPSGVEKKKGLVFRCTATLRNGAVTPFVVTEDNADGAVHYVGVRR
jgi:hypothetical protein